MGENYIVINGKRVELTEEQLQQLGIKTSNNKRWRAKENEKYYCVNTFNQVCSFWETYSEEDTMVYNSHNYFKTKEEAEKYARVLKTEMLLRKYADEHNEDMPCDGICEHHFLYFNNDAIHIGYFTFSKEARKIYFSSREIAGAAIEKIGKERIKEYLTYEW